jgi:c-di-GMP phosphodiesterase
MGWWHRLLEALGLGGSRAAPERATVASIPSCVDALPRGSASDAVAPETAPQPGDGLWRDELLDDAGSLAGHRFVPRLDAGGPQDPAHLARQLNQAGVPAYAQRRVALVALPEPAWGLDPALAQMATPRWVWLVDVSRLQGPPADWLPQLAALRAQGQGLAVCGLGASPADHPAVNEATHAVIDLRTLDARALEQQLKRFRQDGPDIKVMVDQVPAWPDRHWCRAMGAQWTAGPFVSTMDPAEQGKPLKASRLVLLNMLNLVRQEADAAAIAEAAKRDPGLAAQLLLQANSAQHGLRTAITGLEQAIMMMGRQSLYRWLAVAVFRAGQDRPLDRTLLELALSRGRFMELAAQAAQRPEQADELFLVGVLSFVDVLLGLPMPELVRRIELSAAVQQALLDTSGTHADALMLAVAMEKGLDKRVSQLALSWQVPVDALHALRDQAVRWAEEAAR